MSHLFNFPRKIDPAVRERYDLLRKHGRSRIAAVNFICGIGGYSDRHERWPIEFNVKMYPDLDADTLWKVCMEKCDFSMHTWPAPRQTVAEHLFREMHKEHENHLWNWAQEDMYRSAKEDDWFYMDWLGGETRFEWELRGRQSGHLVLESIPDLDLKGMNDEELEERLNEKEDGAYVVPIETVKRLLVVCIELTSMTTRQWLEDECQYKAAWTLWANICEPEFDARWKAYEQRERLTGDADELLGEVEKYAANHVDTFRTICELAGIILTDTK